MTKFTRKVDARVFKITVKKRLLSVFYLNFILTEDVIVHRHFLTYFIPFTAKDEGVGVWIFREVKAIYLVRLGVVGSDYSFSRQVNVRRVVNFGDLFLS